MIKALLFGMPDFTPQFNLATKAPNLGIVSIAGNIDPQACHIQVADLVLVRKKWERYVLDLLHTHNPDIVGLSCMSFQYHSAVKLAKLVKSFNKNILVAIGGYHPTTMYEEIAKSLESEFIDFIVRGEGEATFNELVTAINSGKEYKGIKGLSYRTNGVFCHNPPRELLSLDDIKLPKRNARLLTKGFHAFGLPADTLETSRGCTYNCKFCTIRRMYGRSFRKYEISRIIADIRKTHENGARALIFTDDNITLDLERFGMICEEIVASKLNSIHYVVQADVNSIAANDGKIVKKMADAGVRTVFLGIERLSKTDLEFLGKRARAEDNTRKAVKYLRDNNIIIFGGFILGNPEDDREEFWNTFKAAWDMKIDIPAFLSLIPHAKTEIREELISQGLVTNIDDFSTYHGFVANIKTRHLSTEEIDRLIVDLYDAYNNNIDYIRFTQVRRIYPVFFWKLLAKNVLPTLGKTIKGLCKL